MNEKEIQALLCTTKFGKTVRYIDSVDSTNTLAKKLALEGTKDGTIVIAEHQTAGRGRHGRTWVSQAGKNLTFSVILNSGISSMHAGLVPLVAGLAVARATEKISGQRPVCKWPNDILLGGKKICGILSESIVENSAVNTIIVGIGVNVNQEEFPDELRATASSILLVSGKSADRWALLSSILEHFEALLPTITRQRYQEFLALYTAQSAMFGMPVEIGHSAGKATGIAAGIDDEGGLVIRHTGGRETVWYAGDVTILSEGKPEWSLQ